MMNKCFSFRTLCIVSLISCGVGVLLMIIRIWCAFSFSEPLQLTTSGWEEDSLYAMWKYLNGKEIYADRLSAPYAQSVFNWLYYYSYGFFIKVFISLFSLDNRWLPTIGRFFTLIGALVGVFICYVSFVKLPEVKKSSMRILALSFALLVFSGPLVGFWAFTVRPDVWSLVFELTGVFLFLKYYSTNKTKAVFFTVPALYCSWGFKFAIFTVVAISIFLIVKKNFKTLFMFSLLMIIFYATTLLLGGKEYLDTILFQGERVLLVESAINNLLLAAAKSVPAIVTLVAAIVFIVFCKDFRKDILKNDHILFTIIFLLTSILITVPASAMDGAADNYYFIVLYAFSLTSVILLNKISNDRKLVLKRANYRFKIFVGVLISSWIVHVFSLMAVFTGYTGVVSVYPQHVNLVKHQKCIEEFPKPLFVDSPYLSLPWMNPSEPYVITNYSYKKNLKFGIVKDDGIGGLIKHGHYNTLLLTEKLEFFEGTDLSTYEILPIKCEGLYVYVKKKYKTFN